MTTQVNNKRPDKHPLERDGCSVGYEVRTQSDKQYILGRELWVVRNRTYTFSLGTTVTKACRARVPRFLL